MGGSECDLVKLTAMECSRRGSRRSRRSSKKIFLTRNVQNSKRHEWYCAAKATARILTICLRAMHFTLDSAVMSDLARASFSTEWSVNELVGWKRERMQYLKSYSTEEPRLHKLLDSNKTTGHSWFRSKHGLARGDGWISVNDTSPSLHVNVTMKYCARARACVCGNE